MQWHYTLWSSEQELGHITDETYKRWYFPNAFAAADGKHIHPKESGSEFFECKGFYSVVSLPLVDYNY